MCCWNEKICNCSGKLFESNLVLEFCIRLNNTILTSLQFALIFYLHYMSMYAHVWASKNLPYYFKEVKSFEFRYSTSLKKLLCMKMFNNSSHEHGWCSLRKCQYWVYFKFRDKHRKERACNTHKYLVDTFLYLGMIHW